VAPTDPLPIVHYDAKAGTRDLEVMRWGLIPYWAKDIKIGFSTINARAEEVDTKPPGLGPSGHGNTNRAREAGLGRHCSTCGPLPGLSRRMTATR
jgi:hypothetical protein